MQQKINEFLLTTSLSDNVKRYIRKKFKYVNLDIICSTRDVENCFSNNMDCYENMFSYRYVEIESYIIHDLCKFLINNGLIYIYKDQGSFLGIVRSQNEVSFSEYKAGYDLYFDPNKSIDYAEFDYDRKTGRYII